MKRTLAAAAVLALVGTASAQSSVTLFGLVDLNLQHVSNGGGASVTRLNNSGYQSSRLGFRGVEDLGGGMSASFWLEAGLTPDNGTGGATNTNNQLSGTSVAPNGTQGVTFNRRSTLSLAGSWGELRLGRDYTPQYWNIGAFDTFGNNGVGSAQVLNSRITGEVGVRASNSIGYFLPANLGGLYGQAGYYLGENASGAATSNDGRGYGVRLGYVSGPLDVAVGTGRTNYAAGRILQSNIGASYDFKMVLVQAAYVRDSNAAVDGKGWMLGGQIPVGPGQVRVGYSQYGTNTTAAEPTTKKFALGYIHNFSKRTAVYGTYGRAKNSGGATTSIFNGAAGLTTANGSSSGFDLGIRHSF